MVVEREEGPDDKQGRAILIATLLTTFMTPEQRAAMTAKYPKQMGEVAGIISQVLPPDLLEEINLSGSETPTNPEQPVHERGTKRFTTMRKFVARIPLLRRVL